MEELGVRIKAIRTKKGFKQDEMAEKLGMNQSHYAKLENGKVEIKMERLIKIASIFEMEVGELVLFDESKELKKDELFYYYEWKLAIKEVDKLKKRIDEQEQRKEENEEWNDGKIAESKNEKDELSKKLKQKSDEIIKIKEDQKRIILEKDGLIYEKEKRLDEMERTIKTLEMLVDVLKEKKS